MSIFRFLAVLFCIPFTVCLFHAVWDFVNILELFFSELLSPLCSSSCRWEDSPGGWLHCTVWRGSTPEANLRLAWDNEEWLSHRTGSLQWGGRSRWRRPCFCLWWSWCSGWWRQCEHKRRLLGGRFQIRGVRLSRSRYWYWWRYQSKTGGRGRAAHRCSGG